MFGFLRGRAGRELDARLRAAALKGDAAAARELLGQGADPDGRDPKTDRTAAHLAARAGASDVLTALKEAGADLNAVDVDGDIPLDRAIGAHRLDAVRALFELGAAPRNRERKSSYDPVYRAAYFGDAAILRYLAERGCGVDRVGDIYAKKRSFAVTPLHAAAMGGHLDCLRLLLELGAKPDRGSVPAAFWAVLHRHEDAALLLIEAGGPVTSEMLAEARRAHAPPVLLERLEAAPRRRTGAAADLLTWLDYLWRSLRDR